MNTESSRDEIRPNLAVIDSQGECFPVMSDKYERPKPSHKSIGEIKVFAAQLALELGYSPEQSFKSIIESIGGELYEKAVMPSGENFFRQSCLIVDGIGKFKILTLNLTESGRRRFDIAHELGHYFLHYILPCAERGAQAPKTLLAARSNEGLEETEANIFAINFLISKEKFIQKYDEYLGDKILLGYYFQVVPHTVVSYGKSLDSKYFPNE